MRVSVVKSGYGSEAPIGSVDLEVALEAIKSGSLTVGGKVFETGKAAEQLRTMDKTQKVQKPDGSFFSPFSMFKASNFPAILWGGVVVGMRENKIQNDNLSSHIYFDFDGITNLEEAKAKLATIKCVKAVWVSVSGTGIGMIIKVNTTEVERHAASFFQRISDTRNRTYFKADPAAKDVRTRINFLSYDPSIIIKDDSEVEAYTEVADWEVTSSKTNIVVDPKVLKDLQITEGYLKSSAMRSIAYANTKGIYCLDRSNYHYNTFSFTYGVMMRNFGIPLQEACGILSQLMPHFTHFKEVGNAYSKKYINQLGSFLMNDDVQEQSNKKFAHIIKKGGTLMDLGLTREDVVNKFLVAPTGSGKTYFINKLPGKKVIVTPTKVLAEELAFRYGGGVLNQDNCIVDESLQTIFVTYASFVRLSDMVEICERDVYLDEAHLFSTNTSSGFQLSQLNKVIFNLFKLNPKSITLVSATPVKNYHPLLQYEEIVIGSADTKEKTWELVATKSKQAVVKDSFKSGWYTAVLLNNTREVLESYKSVLRDKNIHVFNANTKEESYFVNLIKNGVIDDCVEGCIATSVIKEGSSFLFKTPKPLHVVAIGVWDAVSIEQFAARWRNSSEVKLTILRSEDYEDENKMFSSKILSESLISYNQELVLEFNKTQHLRENFNSRRGLDKNFYCMLNEDDYVAVDYLAISNAVFESDKYAAWGNQNALKFKLGVFGWKFAGVRQATESLTKEDSLEMKKAEGEFTKRYDAAVISVIETMKAEGLEYNSKVYKTKKASKLERQVRQELNTIYTYCEDEALTFKLWESFADKGSYDRFRQLYSIEVVLNSKRKADAKLRGLLEEFKWHFAINNSYSGQAIEKALVEAGANHGIKVTENGVKLFKILFESETKGIRVSSMTTTSGYKVTGIRELGFKVCVKSDVPANFSEIFGRVS